MSNQFDYDDEDKDVKRELVIPKYTLLYEDMEVEIRQDNQEEKEDHEKEEEEKKQEEHVEEGAEENKNLKPIDRIIRYIAEITQDVTDQKPMSDKELAEKLKRRLDLDPE